MIIILDVGIIIYELVIFLFNLFLKKICVIINDLYIVLELY